MGWVLAVQDYPGRLVARLRDTERLERASKDLSKYKPVYQPAPRAQDPIMYSKESMKPIEKPAYLADKPQAYNFNQAEKPSVSDSNAGS